MNALAAMYDVSVKTVRRSADAKRIPGVIRIGRLLRFDLALNEEFIRQGCPPLHRFDAKRAGRG